MIVCVKLVQPATKCFGVLALKNILYYSDLTFMAFPGHLSLV